MTKSQIYHKEKDSIVLRMDKDSVKVIQKQVTNKYSVKAGLETLKVYSSTILSDFQDPMKKIKTVISNNTKNNDDDDDNNKYIK